MNVLYLNKKIRAHINYEGKVLYFLDARGNVFGVIKKKTAWYIILRALREKACCFSAPKSSQPLSDITKKVTKRIAEIQVWLGFSDEYRKKWTVITSAIIRMRTYVELKSMQTCNLCV